MGVATLTRSASSPTRPFPHRPGLDGLRAIAVVVVVAFHAGALSGGWVGVDIFFVLSGWLITGLMLSEITTTERFDAIAFWRRRIRRLVPALVVALGLATALAVVGALELRTRGVVGALTYSTNWLNITGAEGYWQSFAAPDPLRHLWSLAVEEQIYLVWPLVTLVALRVGRRAQVGIRVAAAFVACASIAIAVHGAHAGWSIDRLYQGTDTRASAFAVGALTAGVTVTRLGTRARHLLVVLALIVALAVGSDGGSTDLFVAPIHLVTLCGVVAVVAAAGIESGPLCSAPMRRIGSWSYGIYLLHYPLDVALDDRLEGVWLAVVVLGLSIPLAALSHRFVEQPIRRHGLPGRALAVGGTVAVVVAAAALVVAVPAVPGGLDRLPSLLPAEAAPAVTTPDVARPAVTDPAVSDPAVSGSTVAAARRVLVVGDSVPALAADELSAVAVERGDGLGVLAQPACVGSPHPADQFLEESCVDFVDALAGDIAAQSPDVIVWWWGGNGASWNWRGEPVDMCSIAGLVALDEQIAWEIELAAGIDSVIVVPPARTDLDSAGRLAAVCQADALVAAAGRRDIDVIRLDRFVCPDIDDDCERVERTDGLHIDGEGATTVARWLLEQPELIVT